LMIVMLPSSVFSNVQVTFSLALRSIMATGPLVLVLAPPVQYRSVSCQPAGTVSVTVRRPGRRFEKVRVLDGVPSSTRLKFETSSPIAV
jgi:hypothetical protein